MLEDRAGDDAAALIQNSAACLGSFTPFPTHFFYMLQIFLFHLFAHFEGHFLIVTKMLNQKISKLLILTIEIACVVYIV